MWDTIKEHKGLVILSSIAIIFIFIAFTYGSYHPNTNSQLFQSYIDEKLKEEKDKYDKIINERTEQINLLSEQLQISQQTVYKKQTEINKLKKEIASINAPLNLQETKERLNKLGYNVK
jgi:peptidoglycan hydrolase CwlO-like protein